MLLSAFTAFHVLVSLLVIASGFVVVYGLLQDRYFAGTTTFFFWTTAITSVTGFMFPFHGFTPAQVLGVISLVALAIAFYARRRVLSDGGLRRTYVTTSVLALYFNFFVLIVQSFEKIPALKALAPTQKEAPFKAAQLVALLLFLDPWGAFGREVQGKIRRAVAITCGLNL